MSEITQVVTRGGGFLGTLALLLTGIFVVGKVFGFLAWSWWMVFLPALIYVGLVVGVPVAFLAVTCVIFLVIVVGYVFSFWD